MHLANYLECFLGKLPQAFVPRPRFLTTPTSLKLRFFASCMYLRILIADRTSFRIALRSHHLLFLLLAENHPLFNQLMREQTRQRQMPAPLLVVRIEQRRPRRERLRLRVKFLRREGLGRLRAMFVEVGVFGLLLSFAVRVGKGELVERGVEPDGSAVHG